MGILIKGDRSSWPVSGTTLADFGRISI